MRSRGRFSSRALELGEICFFLLGQSVRNNHQWPLISDTNPLTMENPGSKNNTEFLTKVITVRKWNNICWRTFFSLISTAVIINHCAQFQIPFLGKNPIRTKVQPKITFEGQVWGLVDLTLSFPNFLVFFSYLVEVRNVDVWGHEKK